MKKVHKKITLTLIFMLIEMFLSPDFSYSSDILLRPPLKTKHPKVKTEMSYLYIRSRFEELRHDFGSKAAWLMIINELRLPEKTWICSPTIY